MHRCSGLDNADVTQGGGSDEEGCPGQDDFLLLREDGGAGMAGEVANVRVALSLFLRCPSAGVSGFAVEGSTPTLGEIPQCWRNKILDPTSILHCALREHNLELYVPVPPFKRRLMSNPPHAWECFFENRRCTLSARPP